MRHAYFADVADINSINVIGAMALTLSDTLLGAAQKNIPTNITAAGLTLIGHAPGISIQELSIALKLSHPGTVRLVDRMVSAGLVTRERLDEDKRAVALHLSPAGHAQEALILSTRQQALETALAGLSDAEISTLSTLSEKLLQSVMVDENHALRICRLCDGDNCAGCPIDAALEAHELG